MESLIGLPTISQSLEWLAMLLSLAYLLLAIRQNPWCWPAAFFSTLIYTGIFWHVSLFMDSALHVYYMAMALIGFWLWKGGRSSQNHSPVIRWPIRYHLVIVALIISASGISGTILDKNTEAAWPYLDSFTTWASVVCTYMVAKKVLENWIYWLVIDAVALVLYLERGLYPTAALFFIYLVMCFIGYFAWRKTLKADSVEAETSSRATADAVI